MAVMTLMAWLYLLIMTQSMRGEMDMSELGMGMARAAMLDGNLEEGIAYTGAGTGLISEIVTVAEVFKDLVDGGQALAKQLA